MASENGTAQRNVKNLLPGASYEVLKDTEVAIKTEKGISLIKLPKGTIIARKGSSQSPVLLMVVEGRQNDSADFGIYEKTSQWENLLKNVRPTNIYR